MNRSLTHWYGMIRSRAIYYWKPGNLSRMRAFYGRFIRPGDLCFDIGAHIGNRTRVWRDLGARVIAVEPQPRCVHELERRFSDDPEVVILPFALSSSAGEALLQINPASPTLSTLSDRKWQDRISSFSFRKESWSEEVRVRTRTLDDLIGEFGIPAFTKIDVEGFEADVLRGLTGTLPHLSLEFFSPDPEQAERLLDILDSRKTHTYNLSLRETHTFLFPESKGSQQIREKLRELQTRVISGDLYAKPVGHA